MFGNCEHKSTGSSELAHQSAKQAETSAGWGKRLQVENVVPQLLLADPNQSWL
jgi:hypothetical protein